MNTREELRSDLLGKIEADTVKPKAPRARAREPGGILTIAHLHLSNMTQHTHDVGAAELELVWRPAMDHGTLTKFGTRRRVGGWVLFPKFLH